MFLMIRRPPRSTPLYSSAASDVYKRQVSMGIWNAVGGRDEVEANNGVAHLLEHMAFKGTLTKNALQIAETIEDVGGDINAYTSKEITAYYVKLLADDLHYGVDILTDILQNSAFAEDELNRERGVIIQEIGMYLDTPDDMIFDYWQEKAFPNQPMGCLLYTSDAADE